jgi:hypothetical protein
MKIFDKIKNSIVLLLLFQSCNTSPVKEEIEKDNDTLSFKVQKQIIQNEESVSFIEIISTIPEIKLPCTLYCGIGDDIAQFPYLLAEDFGDYFIKTISEPEVSRIIGKLPINNDKIYIMYGVIGDIIYPYLNIYDENGYKIDSLYLHISYCLADAEEVVTTKTTINKDFSIYMSDTVQYIHYDENDKIIDSVIIGTRKMNLTKNGYYKVTEETTYKME